WALPTMLRLALLENLRRLADQMLWGWDERRRAEQFAAEALQPTEPEDPNAARMAAPLPSSIVPSDPFVARALQLLRDGGPNATRTLVRLEAELEARGVEANESLRREHRRQAANGVSVGNCVISLRLVAALDWKAFVERASRVEAILRLDPSGVYPLQDFPTRDRQRRAVEDVARRSRVDERAVAARAVEMAQTAAGEGPSREHVGYYLIGDGRFRLRREFAYRPRSRERLLDWTLAHPRTVYFGSMSVAWVALMAAFAAIGLGGSLLTWWLPLALAALAMPVGELAVGIVNHALTLFLPPRVLAKLELKEGIPADCNTIVVMPSMLVRPQSASVLLERLEIHYLANPDPSLRFALLTDFADAEEEHRPEDSGYVADALERVAGLNARYATGGPPKFFLFHRRRLWNPVQGVWMGWERKRGKLSEFNRLVRGATDTSYAAFSDDPAQLRDVRFVITLDADTQMPRDTARRMIGTLAHPLNTPRFDPNAGRVVEGYGVLQPRVSFHLTASTHSRFAGLLASSGGIDPYSTAASDSYMDLFGIGSFTGKGIYDLDSFEAATGHAFPDNAILSHDLIEGNHARCGLLSDTEMFDDFPARYHAYARREHRWARGDWQLLPWLMRTVPTSSGTRPNPQPTLERWKLLDNLRRSLVPLSLLVLFTLGWTVLPGSPWTWTLLGLMVPALPLLQLAIGSAIQAVRGGTIAPFLRWRDSVPAMLGQAGMSIAFLANQAKNLTDAIVRTVVRLYITHTNLLEWETAASTERRLGGGLFSFVLTMWPSTAIAVAIAALVALVHPSSLAAASPVLASWCLAPAIAWWLSRPRVAVVVTLSGEAVSELRAVARKTWH
ncbi:MAG: glycosyltransferase (phosphorylase)/cyclic beta,2-glucan synthetase, partial [Solirubrobacterales bacterium]|nr:glycosyltransferase (phosphorylase)/cyclic beta,2-glucan synthetase [Solirubrobacterales bacterium]